MHASYSDYSQNQSQSLWNFAQKIRNHYPRPIKLPPFILMSDPKRIPNIIEAAQKLPVGSALIYRHFGQDHYAKTAKALRDIDGVTLLIGNDVELAEQIQADGVHMPRRIKAHSITRIRQKHPNWFITQAAPKESPIKDNPNLDAYFVSAIFPSKSPSAGDPIGIERLNQICQNASQAIYALGGINAENANQLFTTQIAGFAAISGIIKEIIESEIKVEKTHYGQHFIYHKNGHEIAELTLVKIKDRLFNASHTGVPKSLGGQSIGKALIKVMSKHARINGYKIIASCPFIAAILNRRPEWGRDIMADP